MKIGVYAFLAFLKYLMSVAFTWLVLWAFELNYNPWAIGIVVFILLNIIDNATRKELTTEQKWNKMYRKK